MERDLLGRIISTTGSTVSSINSIEEVVEGGSLNGITHLVEGNLLGVDESNGVLKIKIGLSVVVKRLGGGLNDGAINQVNGWAGAGRNLARQSCVEEVQISLSEGLGSVLDDCERRC